MKITVLDGAGLNPGDLSWKGFEELGDVTVYDRTAPNEVIERAGDCEVVITNKTVLSKELLEQLPHLKYIGVLATGYNVIDIEAAKNLGIIVTNIPAYSTMSVAQHVFALLLSVTDRVEHYTTEVVDGHWSRAKDFCYWNTPLTELDSKIFGVIGYGNIGKAVCHIGQAFGMKTIAFTSKSPSQLERGVRKASSLDELLKISDVVSLHCPLTPETRYLINSDTINKIKHGAILINTGRGGLIDEEAVAEALRDGRLGAFCADVLSSEPPAKDNPLLRAPNVYITPHIAWATIEARQRLMAIALDNLRNFLSGHPINVV